MPIDSIAKPKKSKLRCRRSERGRKKISPARASRPTGRLTKNTKRQLSDSVSQPPSTGPMIGPTMIPAPQIAIARPCSSLGLMLRRTVWLSGTSEAPKTPCSVRKSTISTRLFAMPQSIEVTMKPVTEVMNSSRSPMRSDSQPVTGVMIAAATI